MRDEIVLGNLNERSIKDIMLDEKVIELQKQCLNCNKCWLNCQRIIDVKLFEYMESKYTHEELEGNLEAINGLYNLCIQNGLIL